MAVELRAFGINEVRVQGIQESWVVGKSENINAFLKKRQSPTITLYKRHGLMINQIIFFVMLVLMPGIESSENRAIFATLVFILLTVLALMHLKLIPNAAIYMGKIKPSWLRRSWPSLVSWISTIVASVIATYIAYLLTGAS